MLKQGNKAPDFQLPDQEENLHTLSDYNGKWVLVYFYPKDMTPGCTKEACALRDEWSEFKKEGAAVLGVSKDSPARHAKFVQKERLPFTLLSDEEGTMIKAYKAWGQKKFMGREFLGIKRISYLIDPEGKIAVAYEKVKPAEHAKHVLEDLKTLKKK